MGIPRSLLLLCIFVFVESNDLDFLSDKQRENLGKLSLEKAPESIRRVIRDVTLHGTGTEHWCCNIDPVKTIVQTKSQLLYVQQVRDRVSYHSCGFLWTKRCSRHHNYYTAKPVYKTIYSTKTIPITCPDKNLVCCHNYALVAEHCLPLDKVHDIKDDLINLNNAGVLG